LKLNKYLLFLNIKLLIGPIEIEHIKKRVTARKASLTSGNIEFLGGLLVGGLAGVTSMNNFSIWISLMAIGLNSIN
jgi:hypothetical protein